MTRKRQNTETVTFLHQPTGEKVTFTGWAAIALFRRTEPWVELKRETLALETLVDATG